MNIRPVLEQDAAAIAAIYRPIVRDTWISFEVDPPSAAEMRTRIEASAGDYPWLVGDLDGRVAGYAYASRHRVRPAYQWSVDVSVYVRSEVQRQRIGSALYRALFGILGRQGFRNAYAGIALPNPVSVAFHEKLGFRPIGVYRGVGYKLGRWWDVGWWGRELSAPAGQEPAPPERFDAVLQNHPEAVARAIREAIQQAKA